MFIDSLDTKRTAPLVPLSSSIPLQEMLFCCSAYLFILLAVNIIGIYNEVFSHTESKT